MEPSSSSGVELHVMVVEGAMAGGFDYPGESLYATLELGSHRVATRAATRAAAGSPLKWQQGFRLRLSPAATALTVGLSAAGSGPIGACQVALTTLLAGGGTEVRWHDLRHVTRDVTVASLCLATRLVQLPAATGEGASSSQKPQRTKTGMGSSSSPLPSSSNPLPPSVSLSPSPSLAPTAGSAAPHSLRPSLSSSSSKPKSQTSKPQNTKPQNTNVLMSASSRRALVPSKKAAEGKVERGGEGERGRGGSTAGQKLLLLSGGILLLALGSILFSPPKRKSQVYEVKKGDTICSIAGCYGLSPDDVVDANAAVRDDPDRIFPGDRLLIP